VQGPCQRLCVSVRPAQHNQHHGDDAGDDRNEEGKLPIIATLELADDGTRYFLCECGGQFMIDRDMRSEAARIRPCQG
jgi:hypothetical protein